MLEMSRMKGLELPFLGKNSNFTTYEGVIEVHRNMLPPFAPAWRPGLKVPNIYEEKGH